MIDDVLAMLEVRASGELPGWAAGRLRASTRVLNVYPERITRTKGTGFQEEYVLAEEGHGDAPVPVSDDPALHEALRNRQAITRMKDGDATRLIAIFEGRGQPRHILDVRGPHLGEGVCDLLTMVRKYYERLVEGETDSLTGLSNRRLFQAHVDAGIRRWIESGHAYYFAMLDLDHFKRVNDQFGHLYGDEILVHFANLMRATFRAGDQLYRFGGEEFVVVFGVTPDERGGMATLERFRTVVESHPFPGIGQVTVSIGFARVTDLATPPTTLIDRADEALYYAKGSGRNRVCSWEALIEAGLLKPKVVQQGDVTLF